MVRRKKERGSRRFEVEVDLRLGFEVWDMKFEVVMFGMALGFGMELGKELGGMKQLCGAVWCGVVALKEGRCRNGF